MRDELLSMLFSICDFLSTCDLNNFADVRELHRKLISVQCKVNSRAFDLYISNLDIKKQIDKELKELYTPADYEIRD